MTDKPRRLGELIPNGGPDYTISGIESRPGDIDPDVAIELLAEARDAVKWYSDTVPNYSPAMNRLCNATLNAEASRTND